MLSTRVDPSTCKGKARKILEADKAERPITYPITDPDSRKARKRRFQAFIEYGNKRFSHRISQGSRNLWTQSTRKAPIIPHYAKVIWDRAERLIRITWKAGKECWFTQPNRMPHI
jgi:hypothetical protein